MRKRIYLVLLLVLMLCACGKDKEKSQGTEDIVISAPPAYYEVDIDLSNIFDYFEFKQYPTYFKNDNGDITSVQIGYGLELKEGYYAYNSKDHKDTMTLKFKADGIINEGEFDINYETFQYSGNISKTDYTTVEETLKFWPKGNRTTTWTFGHFSSSYVIYFQNFYVMEASGKIFITTIPPRQ